MGTNIETHDWTMCREWETSEHLLITGMSLPSLSPEGLEISVEEGQKDCKSCTGEMALRRRLFWKQQGWCACDLAGTTAACTRPSFRLTAESCLCLVNTIPQPADEEAKEVTSTAAGLVSLWWVICQPYDLDLLCAGLTWLRIESSRNSQQNWGFPQM